MTCNRVKKKNVSYQFGFNLVFFPSVVTLCDVFLSIVSKSGGIFILSVLIEHLLKVLLSLHLQLGKLTISVMSHASEPVC